MPGNNLLSDKSWPLEVNVAVLVWTPLMGAIYSKSRQLTGSFQPQKTTHTFHFHFCNSMVLVLNKKEKLGLDIHH